jgi:hypothetical protein
VTKFQSHFRWNWSAVDKLGRNAGSKNPDAGL